MCFYIEADWYAEVVTDIRTHNLSYRDKCCECRVKVPIGARVRRIEMWEHEGCEDNDEDDGFGEHWSGVMCEDCYTLLDAIRSVELGEGCRPSESQPLLGCLIDELHEMIGSDNESHVVKYVEEAERMKPGFMSSSRVLSKLPLGIPS